MRGTDFFNLGDEITRTYYVLRADEAQMQNHRDIKAWRSEGIITEEEEKELHILNFKLMRTYR